MIHYSETCGFQQGRSKVVTIWQRKMGDFTKTKYDFHQQKLRSEQHIYRDLF